MNLIINHVFFYKTEYGVIRKNLTIISYLSYFQFVWKVLSFSYRIFYENFYTKTNKNQTFSEKML